MKAFLLTVLAVPAALATPFDPASIPADANWYLHGNLTALRETTMGGALMKVIRQNQADALNEVQNIFETNGTGSKTRRQGE